MGCGECGAGNGWSRDREVVTSTWPSSTPRFPWLNIRPDRKAFFLNTYNMLVVHASVVLGKPTSALQRRSFFKVRVHCAGVHVGMGL